MQRVRGRAQVLMPAAWVLALLLAMIAVDRAHAQTPFVCQSTVDTYNQYVNVGQFQQAADLTFDPNVVYVIPGQQPYCPYCAVYRGKAEVISLFVQGFLGHFTIWNPLVNLRQVRTNNGGPNGMPRLVDFNDEAFRNHPEYRNRYFRVGVIHDFTFNPAPDCRINQMILYHDPYVASMAFAGYATPAVPIMPGLSQSPPVPSFNGITTSGLINWQFIPGEEAVTPSVAWSLIQTYYTALSSGTVVNIRQFFLEAPPNQAPPIPQGYTSVLVPGDPDVLPFAGLYTGTDEVQSYHNLLAQALVNFNTPLQDPMAMNVTNNGSVVVFWNWQGMSNLAQVYFSCRSADYFQIIVHNGSPKIARLTRFFDTWNVTLAVTNGYPYPQFSNDLQVNIATMFPMVKAVLALVAATLVIGIVLLVCVARSSNKETARRPEVFRARDRGVSLIAAEQ